MKIKTGLKPRKWIIILISVIAGIALLGLVGSLLARKLLQQHHITYGSLSYHFPSSLEVKGLLGAPADGVYFELSRLEVEWSWESLLRRRPAVTRLLADSGRVILENAPGKEKNESPSKLPKFSVDKVQIKQIRLDLYHAGDTLQVEVGELGISHAALAENLQVDEFQLRETSLTYLQSADSLPSEEEVHQPSHGGAPFTLIPEFEIGKLSMHRCNLLWESTRGSQHVQDLELELTGWKSSELLNVQVDRLGLVYQDTLEVEMVLEDGKINRAFHAELTDLGFHVPGISLNVSGVSADLQEGPRGSLTLSDSYLTLGRIRQFYPGIDSILHPSLPDTLRFFLQGGADLEGKQLTIHSFMIRALDSTSFVMSGNVDMSGDPLLAIRIDPLRSTRDNLVKLLAEEGYHQFYLWPTNMDGKVSINGPLDSIDIRGTLDCNEGKLETVALIRMETTGDLFFSLDIWSDSVQVDHITELLPMPVPHGQLRYYMELKNIGQDPNGGSLWIRITSDHLFIFDHYIREVEFSYFGDGSVDSMHASVNDSLLEVVVDLVTPAKGDGTTYFSGDLAHAVPSAFQSSFPGGSVSTRLNGSFLFGDSTTAVGLELDSTRLTNEKQNVTLPEATIALVGRGERYTIKGQSGGRPFLNAETGSKLPRFSLPLPQWLSSWPETELKLHMQLDSGLVAFLTGSPGRMELDTLRLVKEGGRWSTRMVIPELSYQDIHLEQFSLELNSDRENLVGRWSIDSLHNPSIRLDGISSTLGYLDEQYWFTLAIHGSDLLGSNRIALVAIDQDSVFTLRLNDTVPLLISDREWEVELNRGVRFDHRFHLLGGDFGISHGSTRVEAATNGTELQLTIDSLDLEPLLAYVSEGDLVRGTLNGQVEVNTSDMQTEWFAEMVAYNNLVPDPAAIEIEGSWAGESLKAHLDFRHNDAAAVADLDKNGEPISYQVRLQRFDLDALQYFPGLTDQLEVSGSLTGEAAGQLRPEITTRGYLVAEEVTLVPGITGTPILLEHDSLILAGNKVLLEDFRLRDSRGSTLVIEGTVEYSPALELALDIRSDAFTLLQVRNKEAQVQGDLSASADLKIRGGMDELAITGMFETLPGANIKYVSEESFNMVDASQIVTFMDLDEEAAGQPPSAKSSGMKINWDVNLKMDEAIVEILLDEINQEFIRISSKGELNLRTGENQTPMVFGSITSTSGRAFIIPPAVPDLDLVVEEATIRWTGALDDPVINFRGYKIVKGLTSGLTAESQDNGQLVDYRVFVIIENATLSEFDLRFDLEVEDSQAQILLSSLPMDTRQAYALNLLVFGRIGTEKIKGNAMLANQVTGKLNELSRRNLKNAGLSFSSANYTDRSDGINERERTDVSYSLSRGFLSNRLSVSVGGSVGFYMDDLTVLPPSNLIGDVELSYRLSESPMLILKGTRQNVYEGIIDGMVMQESVGLTYQKSFRRFPLLLIGAKQKSEEE